MKLYWLAALLPACLATAALAQSPEAASVAANGPVLRLASALQEALERSPERAAAQSTILAMQRRVAQARALPDPTLSAAWAGKLTPFVTMADDPSSYRGLTVNEQFPAPGKLRLQGEIAQRDVDSAQADCLALERRIALAVKQAFAQYAFADQALAEARQNKALLEKLSAIAEAQYRVGRATQQDVLRAQTEISLQMDRIEQLTLDRASAQSELNAALLRPQDSDLPPAEPLRSDPLRYTLEEIRAQAEANDAALAKARTAIERGKLSVALAERQSRPDIGLGYMYQQRTHQPDMNGMTLTVSLPIFWKTKQREAIAEAVANQRGAEAMRATQQNTLQAEVRRQWLAVASADRRLKLYAQAIAPQTALTFDSALTAYQTGRTDVAALLANLATQLEYKTSAARILADRAIAVARLEALTGASITAETLQETR